MANNVQRLQDAGSISKRAKLSEAEKAVIAELSEEEVKTLIGLRKKLSKKQAEMGTSAVASTEDDGIDVSPSIIV